MSSSRLIALIRSRAFLRRLSAKLARLLVFGGKLPSGRRLGLVEWLAFAGSVPILFDRAGRQRCDAPPVQPSADGRVRCVGVCLLEYAFGEHRFLDPYGKLVYRW